VLVGCACTPRVDLGENPDASNGGGVAAGGGSANGGGGSALGGGTAPGGGASTGGGDALDSGIDAGTDAGIDAGIDAGTDAGTVVAATCTPEGWCWDNPTPVGTTWFAVWVANDDEAWAVGEAGLAYHYLNGTWSLVPTHTPNTLFSIYGFAPDDVWAAGVSGAGVHWDGMQWSPVGISMDGESVFSLWGADTAHVWAGGTAPQDDAIAEADFFDGGAWKFNFTGCFGTITGIWGSAPDDVWFNCNDGNLQHWTAGSVMDSTNIDPGIITSAGMWGSSPGSIWAGARDGNLIHFDGGTWSIAATVPGDIAQLWGTSDSDFWAIAGGAILHFSSGTQWTTQTLPPVTNVLALHGSSSTNVWAVGAQNTLLHYDGGSWSASPAGTTSQPVPSFSAIWAAGPDDAWVAGTHSITHWDGHAWTVAVPSLPSALTLIHGATSTDVWSVGGTLVMHYDGQGWTEHSEGLDGGALSNIWAAGNGEAFGSDGDRQIFRYTPATGWTPVYLLPLGVYTNGPVGLWGSGPTDVWAGGGNGLARWNGSTWAPVTGANAPGQASLIWGSGPHDVYVGFSNLVHHFDGVSWTPVDALTGRYLHSASSSGPGDVWVLDYYEIPYSLCRASHWDGASWSSIAVPLLSCESITTAGPDLVWVVGSDDQIIHMQH
jgi:hypothetical protein